MNLPKYVMDTELGELVRDDRYNQVRRITLDGEPYYLKTYRYTWVGTWILGLLKGNPAQLDAPREANNAKRLRDLGIPCPEPVAFGRYRRGVEAGGYLLSREVPGTALDEALMEGLCEARTLVEPLAQTIRAAHRASIFHRDLYLCHILVDPPETLYIIDVQRAEPRRFGVDRWRVKDLAALDLSAKECGVSRADRLRFFKSYLETKKLRSDHRHLLRRVFLKRERLASHGRKG